MHMMDPKIEPKPKQGHTETHRLYVNPERSYWDTLEHPQCTHNILPSRSNFSLPIRFFSEVFEHFVRALIRQGCSKKRVALHRTAP